MIAPLCCLCSEVGRVTPATVADHHPPHGGDYNKFRTGPLRSLCASCHNSRSGERGYSDAIGADGYPIDARHPFNKTRG
jgi:5-methylcytosine-specific restriction protein A